MLRARILTAAIALPVVLAAIIFAPPWFFTIFIAAIGGFALYEVAAMTGALHWVALPLFAVVGGVPLFGLLYGGNLGFLGWLLPVLVILMMLGLVVRIEIAGSAEGLRGPRLVFIGAAYVGFLFPFFALLRNSSHGVALVMLMLLLAIASDTGAYFVGRSMGRVKLMPSVSPNKTVEGAIGGLVAAIVGGLILRPYLVPAWNIPATVAVSAVVAVLAQLGDLAGSAFKRAAGVKDSGWIFPGHGGLIDRTCSLVFAAVFTYYWTH